MEPTTTTQRKSIKDAAQERGYKVYDTALPQDWVQAVLIASSIKRA